MFELTEECRNKIQCTLEALCPGLPCASLTITNADGQIFHGNAGLFDPLDSERKLESNDVLWFSSTSKLITAIAYLQLVDREILTLDSCMSDFNPALKAATSQVFHGFNGEAPILIDATTPVTLAMMLNQTSGFGHEGSGKVPMWKANSGRGFVNSCKAENLIHTPIVEEPGSAWQYGNSAEWLSYIWPTLPLPEDISRNFEENLRENVFGPLGMDHSSFFPFGNKWEGQVAPIRVFNAVTLVYEPLDRQLDALKLPRSQTEIEYPAGGGGLYSTSRDYAKLLQHLLKLKIGASSKAILSARSVESLFHPTLPEHCLASAADVISSMMLTNAPGNPDCIPGEIDWTSATGIYLPKDGRPWGGYGRRSGSIFFAGVSGPIYWIDPVTGIAVVFTSQLLIAPRVEAYIKARRLIEECIYSCL